jgi:two-component SAPR family response regulator
LEELDYPWFLPDREKLRNLYCEALLWVAGYHLQKKEFTQAIGYLENLTAISPLSEKPHRLLMTAYAGLKDWGLVQKSYQRLVDMLKGVLGIAPTDETQELYKSWGL